MQEARLLCCCLLIIVLAGCSSPSDSFPVRTDQQPTSPKPFVGQKTGVKFRVQALEVSGPVHWNITGQPINKTKPWANAAESITFETSGIIPPGISSSVGITINVKGVDGPSGKSHDSSHSIDYIFFGRTIEAPKPDVVLLMRRYYLNFGNDLDFSGGDGTAIVFLDDVNLQASDKVKFQKTLTGTPTNEYSCMHRDNFDGCHNPNGAVKIQLRQEDFHIVDDGKLYVLLPIRPAPTPADKQPKLLQARLEVR